MTPSMTFQSLCAQARPRLSEGPAGVRETELALPGPPLRADSRILTSGPFTFIHGNNAAIEDLTVREESKTPLVAVHVALRGSAEFILDDHGVPMGGRPGEAQLLASPTSSATVHLRGRVWNEAFRITIAAPAIAALAGRHHGIEPLAARVAGAMPFTGPRTPIASPGRMLGDIQDLMNSAPLGPFRPLYLESRALGWLATSMAPSLDVAPSELPAREIDRMHEARSFLVSHLASPPSLAEVAAAVGTNPFALKRNFKAVFNQPVYAHLLSIRLDHAAHLLRDTDQSIKEIAAAVGYDHATHFVTAFRRAHGVTPGRYRGNNPA
jgi:AraC-like DNA-binding protein